MGGLLQIAGTQLPLPDYARIDLAYSQTTVPGTQPNGTAYTYSVVGRNLEVITNVFFNLTTSSAIANRAVQVVFNDQAGNNLAIAVAPTAQTASLTVYYTYSVGTSNAYGPVAGDAVVGLSPLVLDSGYTMQISVNGMDSGDQIRTPAVVALRIPTGGAPIAPPVVALPTPLLV
jgi:hypothetical protein